jgi:DGQHR domain-containing protein
MPHLTGTNLENFGNEVFNRIGLRCINRLSQVRLLDLDHRGSYGGDEHLELDYLIPYDRVCLIGEITGRSNASNVRQKYSNFIKHYNLVTRQPIDNRLWELLGVPEEQIRYFRNIREFRGFFITNFFQHFDIELSTVNNICKFYKLDWELVYEYSEYLGAYAKPHFASRFNVAPAAARTFLRITLADHGLIKSTHKKIASGDISLSDLYTFEISPYELLPISQVFRRDLLPSLTTEMGKEYQRPLIKEKLTGIRDRLLNNPDFMFPNDILVVLSGNCQYQNDQESLNIPQIYGAISVIDGQHRLFSYAADDVRRRVGDDSKILVTAIKFQDATPEQINKYSAKTFVEINTNQTRIPPTHLDAIAYEILGETSPRALAAQILLLANERHRSKVYGLFDTNQTRLGKIKAITVLTALQTITNINYIRELQEARRGSRLNIKRGYENLFDRPIDELTNAALLIRFGEVCFTRYFNEVARVFRHDWPKRGHQRNTSLEYSKMIAGFVKLLWKFISEGLSWEEIKTELTNIRDNIMRLIGIRDYSSELLDPGNPQLPDAQDSAANDFRFLNTNRRAPTSIQDIIRPRRGP